MTGWRASIDLEFRAATGQTYLASQRHTGPLCVQRAFIDAGGTCQAYLLHPPGGIVGGDELEVRVSAGAGAQALVTSPGAAKFYRSLGAQSRASQHIQIASGACFEWLPQEAIAFSGAIVQARTRVDVESGGQFAGWEILSLGRPAAAERFSAGRFRQSFELWVDGVPLFIDRNHYTGDDPALVEPWGLNGHPILGTFALYPASEASLTVARATLLGSPEVPTESSDPENQVGLTLVDEVLVCRYLGRSSFRARGVFTRIWQGVRPLLFGKSAHLPRIWAT